MPPALGDHGQTLGEAGEAATLARIFPRLPEADAALLGPGDDAAVLRAPDGRYVVTTDTMVHGPDFRRAWSSPHDLGWKAAATNLADVAAMGAVPTALVVALVAPPETPVSDLEAFADGLRDACAALAPGCGVVGGDLSASGTLTIAVTAFGDLQSREPVLRSGARPGDVVALAGRLGLAATGLLLLFERGVDADGIPDAAAAARLRAAAPGPVDAQLAPSPPIAAGPAAARARATAMLDVSDGLAIDARRIAAASGVALDLDPAAIAAIAGTGIDPRVALSGGEDHALLATFPPDAVLPPGFAPIGRVVEGAGLLVDGRPFDGRGGWDPYADWDGAAG
ncbi:thiamine-phosphate kinase [Pseudolysinimonas kribbensis]|uniref:Thiamine-monophosphate kinase n=1 Tax=Pseudolysinimonas kribbensis TaxID=433641 RepID=A0ABQ6K2N0_9MICO|nr:thiamine-phosphate kinase [Pseudolysinimonas kribbensis]GMA94021.1 thiamine-monophosphate kinase [Pseudolysinimonas kribbensis]